MRSPSVRSLIDCRYSPVRQEKKENVQANADGSCTVYFGPKPPPGKEGKWVRNMPGKSWSVLLRLYGPLEPWFEKTWKPGDLELLE
jgi:hypothetical protein